MNMIYLKACISTGSESVDSRAICGNEALGSHKYIMRIGTIGATALHGFRTDQLFSGSLHSVPIVVGHYIIVDVAVNFEELVAEHSFLEGYRV